MLIPTRVWKEMYMSSKLVEFDKFCINCKNKMVSQNEEPCNTCLTNPVNEDSHKPVLWEETEKKK